MDSPEGSSLSEERLAPSAFLGASELLSGLVLLKSLIAVFLALSGLETPPSFPLLERGLSELLGLEALALLPDDAVEDLRAVLDLWGFILVLERDEVLLTELIGKE